MVHASIAVLIEDVEVEDFLPEVSRYLVGSRAKIELRKGRAFVKMLSC